MIKINRNYGLGVENIPNTFKGFRQLKYNDVRKWELLKDYKNSRSNNMISIFTSFDQYVEYKNRIENEIIGLVTSDGIEIKSQSKHFIERVFGTNEDPKTKKSRSGVELEDIKKDLTIGEPKEDSKDKSVTRYFGENRKVSVNKNDGNLILVNPISRKKVNK